MPVKQEATEVPHDTARTESPAPAPGSASIHDRIQAASHRRALTPKHPGGYGRVAIYAVVLAVFMAVLALAVNAIARWRAAPKAQHAA